MEHSRETIAMLIDADNSPSDKIDFILSEMAKYGVVNIRRAYGNWKSHSLKGWEDKLHDYAIRPIQQFDYTKGKNATDMAMTIDAMDLLYSKKLDAFCIVSSDSDFTPLVMRILSEGLNVYGFGQKSAPAPFVNACSTFLYVESFCGGQEKTRNDSGRRKSSQELKQDSKLLTLVRNAVDSAQEEDGWSNLAKIGKHISNQASFDPRNYGFKRLSDLIRSIDLFEIEFRNNNSELYIRDKRKARKFEGAPVEGAASSDVMASSLAASGSEVARPAEAEASSPSHGSSRPAYSRPATVEVKPDSDHSSEPETISAKPAEPEATAPVAEKSEPLSPKAVDPEPVAATSAEPEASAPEALAVEPVSEPSPSTEAKPKRATRSRTTKPRSTSARKTKTTTAEKESEPPKAAEEVSVTAPEPAEPEAAQSSAETPEPEKKPKRTTRRRTTRKKSEPESASAPAEPEG